MPEKMQVFFDDASSGKLKTTEIYLSEDQKRSLVEYLSSYRKMLTNDILKKEFLTWYRVILNDNTTLQIDAEWDSYEQEDTTYMYVVQKNAGSTSFLGTIVVFEFVYAIKKKYIDLKTDDFGRTTIKWSLFSSGILFSCALIVLFLPIEHEKLGLEIPEYASVFVMITCVTVTLYKLRVGLTITASYCATITLFRIIGWILNGLVPGQLNNSPRQNLIWMLMKIVFFAVCIPGFYIPIKKMINSRIKSKNEEVHTSI